MFAFFVSSCKAVSNRPFSSCPKPLFQSETEAIDLELILYSCKYNRSFRSSPGPLYQSEVKCSAFDMEMIFHYHANKTPFHKKGCALGLFLKVRVFGTRKWPIHFDGKGFALNISLVLKVRVFWNSEMAKRPFASKDA